MVQKGGGASISAEVVTGTDDFQSGGTDCQRFRGGDRAYVEQRRRATGASSAPSALANGVLLRLAGGAKQPFKLT